MGKVLRVVAVALGAALGGAVVVALGLRYHVAPVRDVWRRLLRSVANPRQLRTAGAEGAYASVVRHVGRTSGRRYETPVVPVPADGGFVVPLPYGPGTDWVRNLTAAGSGELVVQGRTYAVDEPRVVPLREVEALFPARDRRAMRLVRVDQALRLRARPV